MLAGRALQPVSRVTTTARRLSEEAATLEALGDSLGISKERVRQIESRALEKLRRALLERHPDGEAVFV